MGLVYGCSLWDLPDQNHEEKASKAEEAEENGRKLLFNNEPKRHKLEMLNGLRRTKASTTTLQQQKLLSKYFLKHFFMDQLHSAHLKASRVVEDDCLVPPESIKVEMIFSNEEICLKDFIFSAEGSDFKRNV